tara:strand:- start:803 stop:1180 length:378 start_codon:yes stop_codon:yes gene_type:complete
MLAIVKIAGKQFKTSIDQELKVPLLSSKVGEKIKFADVLYYFDGEEYHFGNPSVKGVIVTATVLNHSRDRKILVYKKKRRKGYQRKNGHRQWFSDIKIDSIKLTNSKRSTTKSRKVASQKDKKSK